MFDKLIDKGFQIEFHSHAKAILSVDFPAAIAELENVLAALTIPVEEIIRSGGGETKGTQRLRRALSEAAWRKVNFIIEKTINGVRRESQSHEVDHVRDFDGRLIALEIEWNNKDPFFDRDLENFKRLHAEGAISVGVIITRGRELQAGMYDLVRRYAEEKNIRRHDDLAKFGLSPTPRQRDAVAKRLARANGAKTYGDVWADHFVSDKYGSATTHWRKLEDRVHRGVGNPCPLLLIGLPISTITFGEPAAVVEALIEEGSGERLEAAPSE